MWQLRSSPKTVKVTQKLAKEWSEMEAAHTDRPLSERRLQVYRKMLENGEFRPVSWAKAFCAETNQSYRVNGKHTSTLFSQDGILDNREVFVVIEEYECETLEDVAKLYSTFDSKQQTRTTADINRSFAAIIPELSSLPLQTVNLLVSGLSFNLWPNDSNYGGRTAAERAELLFDNIEICVWLVSVIGESKVEKTSHLWRSPVVAAMIGSWKKNRQAATDFWYAVRDETGPKPDLPDRKLAKWLTTMRLQGHGNEIPRRFKTLPREFYVRCIHAWNAWRMGEKTNLNYHHTAKLPAFK